MIRAGRFADFNGPSWQGGSFTFVDNTDESGNGATLAYFAYLGPKPVASPWAGFGYGADFTNGTSSTMKAEKTFLFFLNNSPFTLDAKVSIVTVGAATQFVAAVWAATSADQNYVLFVNNAGFHVAWRTNTGVFKQLDSGAVALGKHDVRAEFDGGTMRLLVDGAVSASLAATTLRAATTAGVKFSIGGDTNGAQPATGLIIEEVRVSDIARDGGAYVPSTVPFVSDAHTRGLWHLNKLTLQEVSGLDSSGHGTTLRPETFRHAFRVPSPWGGFGFAPSFTAGAEPMSGVKDFVYFLGASPFTLEAKVLASFWNTGNQFVAAVWGAASADQNYALFVNSAGFQFAWRTSTGVFRQLSSGAVALGKHDVRAEFDGATMRLMVDGALRSLLGGTSLLAAAPPSARFAIGGDTSGGSEAIGIVVEEVRVSDIARNGGAYVPSNVPFVTDANTRGLWHLGA